MARLNNPRRSAEVSLWPDRPTREDLSPSPSALFSSDKESRTAHQPQSDQNTANHPMEPPRPPNATQSRGNKRRRVVDEDPSEKAISDLGRVGAKWFDPDQNPEERREVRTGSRKLQRDWNNNKGDLLQPSVPFSEVRKIVRKHEQHFKSVKQTTDALDDSRQMVEISDLVLAKTKQLGNGISELSINVDDFVNKWLFFGKYGKVHGADDEEDSAPISTQTEKRRRRTQQNAESDDEDGGDVGDIDWELLGERICFPNNKRPPLPSFLLGPLAVQKKLRSTQRQGRQRREPLAAVTKPQDIRAEDLERNEASNLTNQCAAIKALLPITQMKCIAALEADPEWVPDEIDDAQISRLMRKHGLSSNWEIPLLKFAINPFSFGQTIENLFYISFVVKDGFFNVDKDDDGLPTIRSLEKGVADEERQSGAARHQAIFSLNYKTWEQLIEAYDITESMIPHRNEESIGQPNASGWYA